MGRARSTWLFGGIVALLFHAVPTAAQQGDSTSWSKPPAADEFETWLAAQRDVSGRACNRRAVEALGERFIVACGESGLWLARKNPSGVIELVRVDDLGGPVVGLFRREGRVWAEVLRREARDVAAIDDNASHAAFPNPDEPVRKPAPVAPRPHVQPPPAPPQNVLEARPGVPQGRVTEVLLGEVVIDLGENVGLRHLDRVELSVARNVSVGDERALSRQVVAVGVVRAVSDRFARVELGIDERVPLGAIARPVSGPPSESRSAPPRLGTLWHAGFMARPFVALDDLGGGILLDGTVGYRFDYPLHLEAGVSPLGWGTGADKPAVIPASAYVKASYDVHLFEVGFGLGAETVHDTPFPATAGSGILFLQQLRLGSLDGLNLDFSSHVVLFRSQFRFSGLVGRAQIPVGEAYWLTFAGGGGTAGYGYGEIGVKALLRGNGDRGSFFFTGTVGGAGVFENTVTTCQGQGFTFTCGEEVTHIGPMVGAGGEWRF